MNSRDFYYDYSELLGKMKAKKITQEQLAERIRMNPSTLNLKLNNKREFSQTEMKNILKELNLPIGEISFYFFTA